MSQLLNPLSRKARILANNVMRPVTSRSLRKRLRNNDFTMVSSNCIGARFYQELEFPYNTPFVGLFIFAPCYIQLLGDLEHYLKADLSFIKKSKYEDKLPPEKQGRDYPVGVLDGGVEIHFLHYHDEVEAKTKWTRRIERMNLDNLFVTFTDRDFCDESLLKQFDNMAYENKVCFTARKYPKVTSSVYIPEYKGQPQVGDLYTEYHNLKRHFDFVDWLNGGSGRSGIL